MKKAISVVLLVCTVAVVAQESTPPQAPAAAAAPTAAPPAPPAADPPPLFRPEDLQRYFRGAPLVLPDGRVVQLGEPRNRGNTCYFIRTLKPVMPDEDAQRSGFIPLQARMLGTESVPACANAGTLQPLVPVRRVLLKAPE